MDNEMEPAGNMVKPRARQRSTIAFPYMDLKSAIAFADAIHRNVGIGDCNDDQLAAWTDQSAKSSTFRVQVYAARMFGIIEGEAARHKLTELGRQIVDPDRCRAAKVSSFLTVPLYRAVYEQYKGGIIPPAAALERDMVLLGVAEKQKDRARQAFEKSAEQAGFFEHGKNKLVPPGVIAAKLNTPPAEDKVGNGNSALAELSPQDPLIAALIQKLPKNGPWDAASRIAWLNLMNMAFQLSYGPATEIEIKLKGG